MADQDPSTSSHDEGKDQKAGDESDKRIAHYLRMLLDANGGNRWKAAESLGRLKDPRGTDPLIDALFDDDDRVRKKVVWALGEIGDRRALAPLRQLYRVEKEDQQDVIEEAIARINRETRGQ